MEIVKLFVFIAMAITISGQDLGSNANLHVDGESVKDSTRTTVLLNISKRYHVPIGYISNETVTEVASPASKRGLQYFDRVDNQILPISESLADVLTHMTAPDLSWVFEDGVIIISPVAGVHPDIDRFMRAKVVDGHLTFKNQFSRFAVKSIEIKNQDSMAWDRKIKAESFLETDQRVDVANRVVIDVTDMSVRDLLNASLKMTSYEFWHVSRFENRDRVEIVVSMQ